MAKNLVRDKKDEIKKVADHVITTWEEFKPLKHLNILYVWRLNEPRFDGEKRPIAAQTRRLPTRERDIYGYDAEIEVYRDGWREMGEKKRIRLMYHELKHIVPEMTEDFQWIVDDDGRKKFSLAEHDLVMTGFKDEIKEFGLSSRDIPVAETLSQALQQKKEKGKK